MYEYICRRRGEREQLFLLLWWAQQLHFALKDKKKKSFEISSSFYLARFERKKRRFIYVSIFLLFFLGTKKGLYNRPMIGRIEREGRIQKKKEGNRMTPMLWRRFACWIVTRACHRLAQHATCHRSHSRCRTHNFCRIIIQSISRHLDTTIDSRVAPLQSATQQCHV